MYQLDGPRWALDYPATTTACFRDGGADPRSSFGDAAELGAEQQAGQMWHVRLLSQSVTGKTKGHATSCLACELRLPVEHGLRFFRLRRNALTSTLVRS
jgi:hypothetical protein